VKFLRKGIELISIIIPVFNNEKEDIYRCIKSTHSSLYPDVEIIIVDDGSDFDCANYLDIIGIQFDKIKVYHILNQGVSAARNIGIEKARGEYVCFLDADDFLTTQFWIDLKRHEKEINQYDIIYGLVYSQMGNEVELIEDKAVKIEKVGKEELDDLYRHMFDLNTPQYIKRYGYISRGPVARLIRRNILLQNKFDESLSIGEDMIWNLKILHLTSSIGIIFNTWYIYIKNYNSVTHTFSPYYVNQYRQMLIKLWSYADNEKLKIATLNKTYQSLEEIADAKYRLKKYISLSDLIDFNCIAFSYPFNKIWEYKNIIFKFISLKNVMKLVCYRLGLLLFCFRIKKK